MIRPGYAAILVFAALAAGCGERAPQSHGIEPPPVQQATHIHGVPLDGTVDRGTATLLSVTPVALPHDPSTFDHSFLLGNGTYYRLVIDNGVGLVRFGDITNPDSGSTSIPLQAPDPGGYGSSRIETSSPGLSIDRNGRGSVWWEEDGRHIEFRVDGDRVEVLAPGPNLDDPKAPVARRFDITPADREVSFRLSTGSVDVPKATPQAFLGGSGFGVGVSRLGEWRPEAYVEIGATDIPHVDVAELSPGVLRLTIGTIGRVGRAVQVTYDSHSRAWRDHRPLVEFPEAQGVEVGDVGSTGTLVQLTLPWNGAVHDPETGIYWVRPGKPVRHLLQRTRDLRTIELPDGFVAMFEDEFQEGRAPDGPGDMYVLRAKGEQLSLYRFPRPGPCGSSHFVKVGENRFVATFCSTQVMVFELP